MKLIRFVHNIAVSSVAFGVFVNSAIAGTGTCNLSTSTACIGQECGRAPSSTSSGTPCYVKVSEVGSTATIAAQNMVNNELLVCVTPYTQLRWFTSEPDSQFTVTFGMSNPFSKTTPQTFTGDETEDPNGGSARVSPGCYQYSVQHCKKGTCTNVLDPKVIVTSQVVAGEKSQKQRPPDKK